MKQGCQKYFQQWNNHWTRQTILQENYFEGETMEQPFSVTQFF